jgi:hypothetical protein
LDGFALQHFSTLDRCVSGGKAEARPRREGCRGDRTGVGRRMDLWPFVHMSSRGDGVGAPAVGGEAKRRATTPGVVC